jgi:hypothetical protein
MRHLFLFTAAALAATAAQAQTLDAQMQRMAPRQQPTAVAPRTAPAQAAPEQWPTLQPAPAPQAPVRATNASVPWNAGAPATANSAAVSAPTTQGWDSLGSGAIPSLPLEIMQTQTGIRFINGGIGDEELTQLKAQGAEYNVQIMLSAPKGEFISDVTLRILDATGKPLVGVQDAGPYFYVKLPAGDYTLETVTPTEPTVKAKKLRVPASGTVKHHVVYQQ